VRLPRYSCCLAAISALLAVGSSGALVSAESVLFVSPEGKDAWSGRLAAPGGDGSDGPVATLGRAVELSRQQAAGQPRRIILNAGEYYLEQPIDLGPEDSGLTIEAAKGAKVVLYGGRRVREWRADGAACWAAEVPEAKDRRWDFRMLVVGDRLCPRARLPKEFLLRKGHFCRGVRGGWVSVIKRPELDTAG